MASKTTVDAFNYLSGAYSAGTYTLTVVSNGASLPSAPVDGLEIWFKADATNNNAGSGAVLITWSGAGGSFPLTKNKSEALTVGDIVANQIIGIRYSTTATAGFQLMSPAVVPQVFKTIGGSPVGQTTGTGAAYAVNIGAPVEGNSLALATLSGRPIVMRIHTANTGAATLAVTVGTASALAAKAIVKNFNRPLVAGDLATNQEVTVIYDSVTDNFQLQTPSALQGDNVAIVASSRNLIIKNNVGSPNSQIDITADEVLLKTTSGGGFLATSVAVTVNIGAGVALNGLETGGTESASHWYYIWLISDGTNVRGVLEDAGADAGAQPGGPDLSGGAFAGYTYKGLVGQVRNDSGSNFVMMHQVDRRVFNRQINIVTTILGPTSWTAISANASAFANAKAALPPNSRSMRANIGHTSAANRAIAIAADTNGLGAIIAVGAETATALNTSTVGNWEGGSSGEIPIVTAHDFAWITNDAAIATYIIDMTGYTF